MKAVSVEPVARRDGKTVVRALIVASETPETLPTTGQGIEGMSIEQVFAPFLSCTLRLTRTRRCISPTNPACSYRSKEARTMSKILQLVLPFWVMARKYAKSYTDSRMTGLVGLAYGLALETG